MDYYEKIIENINIFFNSKIYNDIKNTSLETIITFFELKYKYPNNINKLIIEDKDFFITILNRYKKILNEGIKFSYDEIINCINKKIITILDSDIKIKYNEYDSIMKEYLSNIGWFYDYYNEITFIPPQDEPNPVIKDFIWRQNQLEAINNLKRRGLETGIHCQATGTGKSYIIINYIDYVKRNVKTKCKIILFTERVNILKDLFDFKDKKVNLDKLEEWKNNGIGDLTEFDIIDRVSIKKKDWVELLNNSTKSTLLVINRAYLTLKSKNNNGYSDINNLDLIIHDECHSSTSNLCHDFLKFWKNKNVPIVGFSATPLRSSKTDGEFNKDRLIEIFNDNNNKLNLLTDYNMIYSINQNLILPPKFYWYNMDSYQTYQTKNKKKKDSDAEDSDEKEEETVSDQEIGSVLGILNDIIHELPNKKIIAWCGTIKLCKLWNKKFNEHKKIFSEISKIETFVDTSIQKTNDYNIFKDKKSYSILFCAQKHREGSDIKKLDSCIFLDKVKNRNSIPFIQSIGRVLRIDMDCVDKVCGVIIDGVVKNNEQYEKIFIDKILGYYFALANLTNSEEENKYDEYIKIRDVVKFDKENKIVNINIHNTVIPINCKKLDWDNVVSKFQTLLEKKVNLTPEEAFEMHINKIRELESFKNVENDFWEEYKKLNHDELGIPEDIYEGYKMIWENKTWYDVLGYNNIYINLDEFRKRFHKKYPAIKKINKSIYLKLSKEFNLPKYPMEYYRINKVNDYNDLL